MTGDQDRIPVATNGHRQPLPREDDGEGIAGTERPPASPTPEPPPSQPPDERGRTPSVNPVMGPPAFTATQIVAGFGVVASLILLVLGRRRRRG
jgi:hypothetical protein